MPAASCARPAFELGLDLCVFLYLPVLALTPLAVTPLAVLAGLCAFGLAAPDGVAAWRPLRGTALLFAALVAWGLISALWAVDPPRSLLMAARLAGLFAVGLSLMAAAPALAAPERLLAWAASGLVLALVLAGVQYATSGVLTRSFLQHAFNAPRLNQVQNAFALLVLPLAATLALRRERTAAALIAALTVAAIFLLVGDAERLGFVAGLGAAALAYLSRRWLTRLAAAAAAIVILTAPLTFPALIHIGPMQNWARAQKQSVEHRLEIWQFAGAHIADRPLGGWGLDSSRAIPGGTAPTSTGVPVLPLHPHNVTLQIWLELGLPGAALFALFVVRLWLALGAAPWPRLYAAAAAGSLAAAFTASLGSYGLWQEWWIGSEFLTLFLILAMARLAAQPIPETARGSIS